MITVCAMVATLMQALDSTIANVALPYMQGSLSASYDEITWVLTSYVVAAAIMTAPVGWLAARFGQKKLYLVSVIGFTVASMACGVATSLSEMVVYRLIQGVFGAALVPLSQGTMLNIYPAEKRGSAMAIWGMGVMVGPILGPTLGGYLTELYNWRYVFFVNLPFGVVASAGLWLFLPSERPQSNLRFDWFGFTALAIGIAGLQLMLDRGETKDWFGSTEIIVEALIAAGGFYLFLVHLLTAERPFITPAIFRDRSFASGIGRDVRSGHGAVRLLGIAGALAGRPGQLSGGDRRASAGAARRRHHAGDADRRPPDQPHRSADHHGLRGRAAVVEPVAAVFMDAGGGRHRPCRSIPSCRALASASYSCRSTSSPSRRCRCDCATREPR